MAFKIMTCGDGRYFEFLYNFERNVRRQFGFWPVIYDLGLEEEQRQRLKSDIRKVVVPEAFNTQNSLNYIRTTHKPHCVLDCLATYPQDCLYVDADAVFVSAFAEDVFGDADIAVTPRHPKERKEKYYANGLLNAGVIFFRNNQECIARFVSAWRNKCEEPDVTDQKALSDLLSEEITLLGPTPALQTWQGLKVELLDAKTYNDVSCRTGKLFHFKNAGRTEIHRRRYRRFVRIQAAIPGIINLLVTLNRRCGLMS